jgi:oligosaccharide repeat unit polymerase
MIVFTFYFGTILTALLRVGNLDSNLDISSKTTNYFIGFLPAFSEWIEEFIVNYGKEDLTLGAYTFAGIYELLGFGVRQQGLIQEFVSYGDSVGGTTNIYTVFRFLIMDYGLFGSLFLTLSLGFTMPLIYFHASTGHRFSIVLLAIFYASSLWSHTASIFVYNTNVLSLIIYAIYVLAFSRKQIKKTELMV